MGERKVTALNVAQTDREHHKQGVVLRAVTVGGLLGAIRWAFVVCKHYHEHDEGDSFKLVFVNFVKLDLLACLKHWPCSAFRKKDVPVIFASNQLTVKSPCMIILSIFPHRVQQSAPFES
jgi:hypothetical protein